MGCTGMGTGTGENSSGPLGHALCSDETPDGPGGFPGLHPQMMGLGTPSCAWMVLS